MGSAVFRVRRGEQIVAQYNPIVKNPNTKGQQETRAKFKLLSQLGAVLDAGIGTMGVTKSKARQGHNPRNGFFQKNYSLVEVEFTDGDTDGVVTKIPMEQVQLTSSFRALGEMSLNGANGEVHISMSVPDTSVKSVRCVLVGYPESGGLKQATIISMADFPVENNEVDESFENVAAGDYTILAYGLIPTESAAGKINMDSIHTPADEDFISAVELNKLVADGSIVETMTLGANVSVTA